MVTGEVVCSVDAKVVPNLGFRRAFFFFKMFWKEKWGVVFFLRVTLFFDPAMGKYGAAKIAF